MSKALPAWVQIGAVYFIRKPIMIYANNGEQLLHFSRIYLFLHCINSIVTRNPAIGIDCVQLINAKGAGSPVVNDHGASLDQAFGFRLAERLDLALGVFASCTRRIWSGLGGDGDHNQQQDKNGADPNSLP